MKQKPVFWHIFSATLLLLLSIFTITAIYLTGTFKTFYYNEVEDDLKARAYLLDTPVRSMVLGDKLGLLREFCRDTGRKSATRITVIDPGGIVLADSNEDPDVMELHNTRPEFVKALSGSPGRSIRYSHTLHKNMLYVAIPLVGKQQVEPSENKSLSLAGALRVAIPLTVARKNLWHLQGRTAMAGFIIFIAAVAGALFISSRLSRPLERMKKFSEKIAKGDLETVPAIDSSWMVSEEITSLSMAMNTMALQIRDRINTIDRQKNELQMVFCALKEAVIVLDIHNRIVQMNRAAAELFAVEREKSIGRTFTEITRDVELNRTLQKVVERHEPAEMEIACRTHGGERFLNARFAVLTAKDGEMAGILVVIGDLTEIRKLENIRKEFVANVSHELKTPVTSIRGYAEVLLEGEVDSAKDRTRFLEIVVRQATRLQAIVEDLLALSRIEQDARTGNIRLEEVRISDILASVRDMCELRADRKEIKLSMRYPEDLYINANPPLMGQAVSNLVINAIKYSDNGSTVYVDVSIDQEKECGREIVISVRDTGCGIAAEHLPRIFERFYRSDKARSRKLGGTGLGLAIVKHIAGVHGGAVGVESTYGKGSVFSIYLPLNRNDDADSEKRACGL